MNASNPFQIPDCLQASLQLRRRERFKKGILAGVTALAALLTVLLILGCNSEHARAASTVALAGEVSTGAPVASIKDATMQSPSASAEVAQVASPIVVTVAMPTVSKEGAAPSTVRPATLYVVRAADTLSRIAKEHRTTVCALKAANGLDTDRISIGMKLILPEV